MGSDLPRLIPNLSIVAKDGTILYRGSKIASIINQPHEEGSIQEQMRDCFAKIATICAPDKLDFVHNEFCIIVFLSLLLFLASVILSFFHLFIYYF